MTCCCGDMANCKMEDTHNHHVFLKIIILHNNVVICKNIIVLPFFRKSVVFAFPQGTILFNQDIVVIVSFVKQVAEQAKTRFHIQIAIEDKQR